MSVQIDNAFVKQFESEVKVAYQRDGAKLLGTVRRKTNIKGKDTTFQKVGKGTAGTKSKHGLVPLMSVSHTPVLCTLADYYAGDYIDALDELKTNIDERQVVAKAGSAALGRKSDDLIVTAASAATTNALIATGGAGLTQAKITQTFERFGNQDVPDDGQRIFVVSPDTWTDLLGITAFSSADYIADAEKPWTGMGAVKRWLSFSFMQFSGLANGAGGATEVRCLAYHQSAIGHASGQDIKADMSWVGERQSTFCAYSMSQGAVNIDEIGIQAIDALR